MSLPQNSIKPYSKWFLQTTQRFKYLIFEVSDNQIQNEALMFQPIMSPDALSAQKVV